jgi:hypothetical protein
MERGGRRTERERGPLAHGRCGASRSGARSREAGGGWGLGAGGGGQKRGRYNRPDRWVAGVARVDKSVVGDEQGDARERVGSIRRTTKTEAGKNRRLRS